MNRLIVFPNMGRVKSSSARSYRSTVREESARRTRRAVTEAAATLFVERGFAATSLADVATLAGVARPTVFAAFGSKQALLQQVLDEALAGDDDPVPVAERPWFQPVWTATTPAQALDAYARACVLIGRRAARIFEAVRRAADASSEGAAAWDRLLQNRRAGAQMVIDHVVTLAPLPRGLSTRRAVDRLSVFNDPALYDTLVNQCGWSERSFAAWLADQMQRCVA